MQQFVILDPSLKSYNGHFLHYDNVVAVAAAKRGYEVTTLAHKDVAPGLKCDFKVIKCFTHNLEKSFYNYKLIHKYQAARWLNRVRNQNLFYSDLNDVRSQLSLDSSSIIFLHTTTFNQILPAAKWLKKSFPKSSRPQMVILLRYAPTPNPYFPAYFEAKEYQTVLSELAADEVSKNVHLVTDSEVLQSEYSELTTKPVSMVPIPHTFSQSEAHSKAPRPQKKIMSYLGNARSTKGFHYLPYVVEKLKDEFSEQGSWKAEFQSNVMFAHDMDSVNAVEVAKRLPITLLDRELTHDEYTSLLLRSDLIALPYQLLHYYSQTSGVLCEALGAGIPVVVPRGTWLSIQIRGRNVGETFAPGDRVDLLRAVKAAMDKIDLLKSNAEAMRGEWIAKHNPDNFMNSLLGAVH